MQGKPRCNALGCRERRTAGSLREESFAAQGLVGLPRCSEVRNDYVRAVLAASPVVLQEPAPMEEFQEMDSFALEDASALGFAVWSALEGGRAGSFVFMAGSARCIHTNGMFYE